MPYQKSNRRTSLGLIKFFRIGSIALSLSLLLISANGCAEPVEMPEADSKEPVEQKTERVVAGVGVTGKGNYGSNPVSTPASVYWKTKERLVFEIQIKQALDLYHAERGYYPKTEEEFYDRIIKFNHIQLPELPEGHVYVYDAEAGQLMVERPVEE